MHGIQNEPPYKKHRFKKIELNIVFTCISIFLSVFFGALSICAYYGKLPNQPDELGIIIEQLRKFEGYLTGKSREISGPQNYSGEGDILVRKPKDLPEQVAPQATTEGDAHGAALIAWSQQGLNKTTKSVLPIFVAKSVLGVGGDRATTELGEGLKGEGFNITTSKSDAALVVNIDSVSMSSMEPWDGRIDGVPKSQQLYRVGTTMKVSAVWFDGRLFVKKAVAGIGFATENKVQDKSFDDAVANIISLFKKETDK